MKTADELIDEIVAASQIPSRKARREVARELRAHIEDFVLVAREAGHSEDDVQRLLLANFGDPNEVAREFASLYRYERGFLRISVFLISTIVATLSNAVAVIAIQGALSLGLGSPASNLMSSSHLLMESLYVAATAAAYVGLVSLHKLFTRLAFQKAVGTLAISFGVVGSLMTATLGHAEVLLLAFVSGVGIRGIQIGLRHPTARAAAVIAGFVGIGAVAACQSSEFDIAILRLGIWASLGICFQLMTPLASRLDRALLGGIDVQN